ncbi:recombinase family protein [Bacillus salinus]|uniref:recombinase family protein n=1 Tax=Bacillus sp. HMF5848 TaxID=2495421 RepID=UPI0021AD6ABC|nr:recombinase family protein [Bacillus sp. HMF5848]
MHKKYSHLAIYLRISQEKKHENEETLKNHRDILTTYAESIACKYDIFGEVISGGKSELDERKQLHQLLHKIEKYDAILCFELSRLSRNGLISQTVKQYCMDYDKPILTPYYEYDLSNNENDRLMFDVGSIFASHEHSIIGKRSKQNKLAMARAGLHVSGTVPFGYKRNKETRRLEIDEEEAQAVRYMYELYEKRLGSYKIRDILNREGYKTRQNSLFSIPTIKRILKNPVYKGTIVFNDRKRKKKDGKFIYENIETITVDKAHPWIIHPDQWERVNKEQVEKAKKTLIVREKAARKTGVTMLKDLIYCGVCGRKMAIRKDNKSATGYTIKKCEYILKNGERCNNGGIKLECVEWEVKQELTQYKQSLPQVISFLQKKSLTNLEEQRKTRLAHIEKQLTDNRQQQQRLLDLALHGLFSDQEIIKKKQALKAIEQHLQSEKLTMLDYMPFSDDTNELLQGTIDLVDKIDYFSCEKGNEALKHFISKIYYTRIMPDDLLKKSTQSKERRYYPFCVEIEYKA